MTERQLRADFLEMLEAAIFFNSFPELMASYFRQVLQTYSEICFFLVQFNIQCPRNSQWEVHMKYWQNLWKLSLMIQLILQLICIISSNPQPSPGTPFPQMSHFSPMPPGRTTSKTPLLYTSETALLCIFSSILNHRQENQKNSIIKGCQ